MLLEASQSQLLLIDYQSRLMPAMSAAADVLANALRLAHIARRLRVPVLGTEQSPDKLGPLDDAVRAACDQVVSKTRFSAASAVRDLLRENATDGDRRAIVIAGCEAHVCLLQTALDLNDDGWRVWVAADACGSRTAANRDAAFQRLSAAGCHLVTTEMVGFEWLGDAAHPAFRDWQALIR